MRKLQDRVQKAKDQVNLRAIKQSYHFPFMHAFIALGWLFEGLTVLTETKVIPLKCFEILKTRLLLVVESNQRRVKILFREKRKYFITVEGALCDNINRMITITDDFYLVMFSKLGV